MWTFMFGVLVGLVIGIIICGIVLYILMRELGLTLFESK